MPKVALATWEKAPLVYPPAGIDGQFETRALYAGTNDPLHLYLFRLQPGATIRFEKQPRDSILYIWQGSVEVAGTRLDTRSSATVEHGASFIATSGGEGAAIAVFSPNGQAAAEVPGGHVHLLPDTRVPGKLSARNSHMRLHADAQLPCTLWLHEQIDNPPDDETKLHSHTADEIMFVTGGAIRIGNRSYGPGTALAVAGDAKYSFFSGPEGLSFVNFRGTASTYTAADGSMVLEEVSLWHNLAGGKPDYISLQG